MTDSSGQQGSSQGGSISVEEALAAIRKKKAASSNAPQSKPNSGSFQRLAATPRGGSLLSQSNRRRGRPTATYWLHNLQDSIQKGLASRFESIQSDPGAKNQIQRRDFVPTQRFIIPDGIPQEVLAPEHLHQGTIATQADLRRAAETGNLEPSGRILDKQDTLILSGQQATHIHKQLQKEQQNSPDYNPPPGTSNLLDRFGLNGSEPVENFVLEEVTLNRKQQRLPRKALKINPSIRKMFAPQDKES